LNIVKHSILFQVILSSGKAVSELQPQLDTIVKCPATGVIVSGVAPSDSEFDFMSRFFCPKLGISEVSGQESYL